MRPLRESFEGRTGGLQAPLPRIKEIGRAPGPALDIFREFPLPRLESLAGEIYSGLVSRVDSSPRIFQGEVPASGEPVS